jgi:hypothetical protein
VAIIQGVMSAKQLPLNYGRLVLSSILVAVALVGCGKQTATEGTSTNAKPEVMTVAGTTFSLSPNPVKGNADGLGIVKLAFTTDKTKLIEIHVGSPSGTILCRAPAPGVCDSGLWVNNGMVFYLQDGTAAKPDDAAATLGYVTAHVN